MRLIVTTLLLSVLSLMPLMAQGSISGTVVDAEDGKPIAGVYVCAFSGDLMVAAGFTDDNGRFSFSRYQKRPDRLSASFLGYALTEAAIPAGESTVSVVGITAVVLAAAAGAAAYLFAVRRRMH